MNSYPYSYGYTQAFDRNSFLSKTFRWMFLGLLATFAVAYTAYQTNLVYALLSSPILLIAITIAEFVVVFRISSALDRISSSSAVAYFFAYAVLNGLVFSSYFLMFRFQSLIFAFAAAAIYFGIMALYGARTSRDLSSWGSILSGGLIALIICGVIGMFLNFAMLDILYCGVGLVIFMGLTAYDVQKITRWGQYAAGDGDREDKSAILGALELYLDFINIFLFILRLMGRNDRR